MRYLPLTQSDRQQMLATIGARSIDDLFVDVPGHARLDKPISGLANHASEMAVERHFAKLAQKNSVASDHPFFLGAGAYKHHVPASVDHLIQRQRDVICPAQLHADFAEHGHDAGVLADRAMTLGTHPGIDQNLLDGVFGRGALLPLVGGCHGLDEIG